MIAQDTEFAVSRAALEAVRRRREGIAGPLEVRFDIGVGYGESTTAPGFVLTWPKPAAGEPAPGRAQAWSNLDRASLRIEGPKGLEAFAAHCRSVRDAPGTPRLCSEELPQAQAAFRLAGS